MKTPLQQLEQRLLDIINDIPEQRNDYLNVIVATLESTIEAEIIPFLAEEQKQIEQAFEAGAKGVKGERWWWNGRKYFDENY